ncbi:MAG: D-alanyl-D-alanine carboxypeptidase family protein [Opitutaceae bacterium]
MVHISARTARRIPCSLSHMILPRWSLATFLLCAGLMPVSLCAAKAHPTRSHATANPAAFKGLIVMDAATGQVLIEDNADIANPPASMTKLMTFLVVHDKLQSGALTLATPIKITTDDARMGGTQVFLDPRETFSVEELLYAMMIQSANDAAHALARQAAGSIPAFVELMNAKAREIGMTHTTFRSPHGLPPPSRRIADGDLTTPRDFAILSRYLLLKTDVLKYTSVQKRDFGPNRAKGPQHMINHNKLLGKVAGVDGLKTGFTDGAGYCISVTAQRNGRRVIVVIMGSFGPGGAIDRGHARDLKAIEMVDRGFAALAPNGPGFRAEPGAMPEPSPISAAPAPAAVAPAETEAAIKFSLPSPKK